MDEGLFTELVTTPGISGREERIRDVVVARMSELVDDVHVDKLGSVIGKRKGDAPKVMLSAHMDSIGFLVKHVDDEGFVWPSPVGGFDARTLTVQRVLVAGRRDYVGLMYWKTKPIHVLTSEEKKKSLSLEDLYIDLMIPADEVKENVSVADPITLYRTPLVNDYAVSAPYLDDRLGVYVLLKALERAKKTQSEIHAVVSVQEEVGLRGARTSAYGAEPDIGVALDITLATDTPGVAVGDRVSRLGEGASITVMNGASISDPRLVREFERLAKANDITHQKEILPRGGTDAGAIQASRGGVPVITISTPVRYVHTANEMAAKADVDATVDLMVAFLESAHDIDLSW
ncbi:MAG: M20/M25/M40 family metallo-hydrolase [Actinomycetota bacterium]|nr:M20/M25/M40 family metallo-hydrolase [Actinomycetota bacterium]